MFRSDADIQKDVTRIRKSKRFDEAWYMETYKDVAMLGMDPIEHYVKYGHLMLRDPSAEFSTGFYLDTHQWLGPQQKNPFCHYLNHKNLPQAATKSDVVLLAAYQDAKRGLQQREITLAEEFLPPKFAHTVSIFRANKARARNDEAQWLTHFNNYIKHFGAAPLVLRKSGASLLSRLTTDDLPAIASGPLITVIMPAWNAEKTVEYAAKSILAQTWQPLELLIVDDASTDGTWEILTKLAKLDKRVKIIRNNCNVGPYVSKNVALMQAKGDFITGHDADDWALPQRLENHIRVALEPETPLKASLTYMVRMQPDGQFDHFSKIGSFSHDGVSRLASISCLFEGDFLRNTLGFWDSVRFAADSEMISRARSVLGNEFRDFEQISMICLDLESSLTNDPVHGIRTSNGLSRVRQNYKNAWSAKHTNLTLKNCSLEFIQSPRKYPGEYDHAVPVEVLKTLLKT